MMVAMMLPSLVPMLARYREAVGTTAETRLGWLTALVGISYFFVWTMFGIIAFPAASRSRKWRCSGPRWRVLSRSPSVWSFSSPVRSSAARGRCVTLPAAWSRRAAVGHSRRTPARPGDMASASGSTAPAVLAV
jgi:Predicted metal-binding integral membrane protein (DUF2182)